MNNHDEYLNAKKYTPNYYVYIIQCKDGTYYTGVTDNLSRRSTQHKLGLGSKYTKRKGFEKIVYFEKHANKEWAYEREQQIKEAGVVYKKMLITQFYQDLSLLKDL